MVGAVGEQALSRLPAHAAPQPAPGLAAHLSDLAARFPAARQHRAVSRLLLQQQLVRAHRRIGEKAAADAPVAQGVCRREQAHARVVYHRAVHDLAGGAARPPRREVERLLEAPSPQQPAPLKAAEVLHRRPGRHRQRQKARVGCDDVFPLRRAPQGQRRAAVRLVAVVFLSVEGEIRALGDAPGLPGRDAPPLRVETEAAALVEKAAALHREKERRHQVFKHCPCPAGQTPVAVLLQLPAPEPPPVPQRRVALRDGEIARQHRLARHQIVEAARAAALGRIPGDGEKGAHAVIEEGKVHRRGQRLDLPGQLLVALLAGEGRRDAQPRPAVAAVHGGEEGRVQRLERARVVPVVKMPPAARQALHRGDQTAQKGKRLRAADHPQVAGRGRAGRRKAHVGGRRAVRRALRRLVLHVVRRQEVVLLAAELRKIAPGVRRALPEPFAVGAPERFGVEGGQAQRPGGGGGEQPQQSRRAADHRRGEKQA